MKKAQPLLPGMPKEKPVDHEHGQESEFAWYLLQNSKTGRYWAVDPVTGREGFLAAERTDPDVVFFNTRSLALRHGIGKRERKAVQCSRDFLQSVGFQFEF